MKEWNTEEVLAMQMVLQFDDDIRIFDCKVDSDKIYFLVNRLPRFPINSLSRMIGKKLIFLVKGKAYPGNPIIRELMKRNGWI